jgi:hypothetical protein
VAGYVAITGDPVKTQRKQNLVATCYRPTAKISCTLVEGRSEQPDRDQSLGEIAPFRREASQATTAHSDQHLDHDAISLTQATPGLAVGTAPGPRPTSHSTVVARSMRSYRASSTATVLHSFDGGICGDMTTAVEP